MRLAALDRDELETRAAESELGAALDRRVRLEALQLLEVEAAAEEILEERMRPVEVVRDLAGVVGARDEARLRLEAVEIAMAADVVPVCVRDENRRQGRQLGKCRAQRLVRLARRIGPGACIDTDQLAAVVRDDEVVLGELEARQRVHPARHDFGDAPRGECVPGDGILAEWRDQRDRLRGCLLAFEYRYLIAHFRQPPGIRCTLGMLQAPLQVLRGAIALPEETSKLRAHSPRDPAHHKYFAVRQLLGAVKHRYAVLHPAEAVEQRNLRRSLRPQQRGDGKVKRLAAFIELRFEFPACGGEELRALALPAGIRELPHQEQDELRVARRRGAVDDLEVLELRPVGCRRTAAAFVGKGKRERHGNGGRGKQPASRAFHWGLQWQWLLMQ